MAHKQWITPRITNKYVDSYAHLDQWGNPIEVKVLGETLIETSQDFDSGDTVKFGVAVPKNVDTKLALQALRDTFNRTGGCHHEYDCCGCASYYAKIRPVKKGFFSVIVKTSYNY